MNRKQSFKDKAQMRILSILCLAALCFILNPSLVRAEKGNSGASTTSIKQQRRSIKGHVTDSKGEPLIGVNVVEAGTTNGTVTDIDGNFNLQLNTTNAKINFSYIGFKGSTVVVGNKETLDVILEEETSFLDEVVVVGYGTMKQSDLTGAISTIKTEELQAESPRSVQDLLRGNSAGLNIGFANSAKGDADLQVRGKNTLKAGSSPLIVLDGVIFEGDLSDINPMDIASIDVLKDASSAAVYGAKAANGVIVMMTQKGGRGGKPVISFNASVGVVQSANQPKLLSPEGFLAWRQDYEIGKRSDDYLNQYPQIFQDPRKLEGVNALDWYNYDQKDPVQTVTDEQLLRTWASRLELKSPEIDNFILGRTTDWADKVFHAGLQQDYQVSISNRKDDVTYYWSIGYTDREGIIVGNRFSTVRSRLNLESTVTSFLKVGLNAGFASRNEGYLQSDWSQMSRISPYGADEIGNTDVDPYLWRYPTTDVTPVNPFYDNMYRDRKDLRHTLDANLYAIVTLPFDIEYQVNYIPYIQWHEYFNHDSSQNFDWSASGGRAERSTSKDFR